MSSNTRSCVFCGEEQNQNYGDFKVKQDISCHTFCLLSATDLAQQGQSDNDGILGFLLNDIRQTVQRAQEQFCLYCNQAGAAVSCYQCKGKFHYSCGKENLCLTQLFDEFKSFCQDHRPNQLLPPSFSSQCPICDEMCDPQDSFFLSCCNKSWIHTRCSQTQAKNLASIDDFRCPACDTSDAYLEACLKFGGIFIHDSGSAEVVTSETFRSMCSKAKCVCPYGTQYQDEMRWSFWPCTQCHVSKIHQSCREARDTPNFVCVVCRPIGGYNSNALNNNHLGSKKVVKLSIRKLGGIKNPIEEEPIIPTVILEQAPSKDELITVPYTEEKYQEVSREPSQEDKKAAERAKKKERKKERRNKDEVGFDAEFSDISSGEDETMFEKDEKQSSPKKSSQSTSQSMTKAEMDRVVVGDKVLPKPIVNAYHPAIRDLTKPPKGTKFTARKAIGAAQFVPRSSSNKQQDYNNVKLDPHTILSLASSGNPANIEKADRLLQQLTSRYGGAYASKPILTLPTLEDNSWTSKYRTKDGREKETRHSKDYRRSRKSSRDRHKSSRHSSRHKSDRHRHSDRHSRSSKDRGRSSDKRDHDKKHEKSKKDEKVNLDHVPKSLVDHVVRDIETRQAKLEAEEKIAREKKDKEKLELIAQMKEAAAEEAEEAKKEAEAKKTGTRQPSSGGWKPVSEEPAKPEEPEKPKEEPEEGEAESSDSDSSSSSSSDSDSSDDEEKKKDKSALQEKKPEPVKEPSPEPEPEVNLTEEQQITNLKLFSEYAAEYKKKFRTLEDGVRKVHTDVVFYAERVDQDMIEGVQAQMKLYQLEIQKLYKLCSDMKLAATTEGTKSQLALFICKIGDSEKELTKTNSLVDDFASVVEKIIILEELLIEQIKEEAVIVDPIMKQTDLRTQLKETLEKVKKDIENALSDSGENPRILHRRFEQNVNKLNSLLKNTEVKHSEVGALEAAVMEHQENLGKHLKELKNELTDRQNLKTYVEEIAKLLASHKATAQHIEESKGHPQKAISCIQSLRKEYKRLTKCTDKYRVKYSSVNLQLPDGYDDILNSLKEKKAVLEIDLEQLVSRCESWRDVTEELEMNENSLNDSGDAAAHKKKFGFNLKLSDETQKVIKDGNLLKQQAEISANAASALNQLQPISSDSDSDLETSASLQAGFKVADSTKSDDEEMTAKIPDYLKPLPKLLSKAATPLMPPPASQAISSTSEYQALYGHNPQPVMMAPPVPPPMPSIPPAFMNLFNQNQQQQPQHQQYQQQQPVNTSGGFQYPQGGYQYQQQQPGQPIQGQYMHPPQQQSGIPGLGQSPIGQQPQPAIGQSYGIQQQQQQQPMYSYANMTPQSTPAQIQASPMTYSKPGDMKSFPPPPMMTPGMFPSQPHPQQTLANLLDPNQHNQMSMSEDQRLMEAVKQVTSELQDSSKKSKKNKKKNLDDPSIQVVDTFPKAPELNLPPTANPADPAFQNYVQQMQQRGQQSPDEDDDDDDPVEAAKRAKKLEKEKRRKNRKGGRYEDPVDVQANAVNPQAAPYAYAAQMTGLETSGATTENVEESYDPMAPTYTSSIDTSQYSVLYRADVGDFVLVPKETTLPGGCNYHNPEEQPAPETEEGDNLSPEALKRKEQLKKERKERKKAEKEARRREMEEEAKKDQENGGEKKKPGPLSRMLGMLAESQNEEPEKNEETPKVEEKIEHITSFSARPEKPEKKAEEATTPGGSSKDINSTTPELSVKTQDVSPTHATNEASPATPSKTHVPEVERVNDSADTVSTTGDIQVDVKVVQDKQISNTEGINASPDKVLQEPTSTIPDESLGRGGEIVMQGDEDSEDDEQPSLEQTNARQKKKKATAVSNLMPPPPPPQRKRSKKQVKYESTESDSSSSSDEEPKLTKKQMKKMMKYYAMIFQKSHKKKKSKKSKHKKDKEESGSESDSDAPPPPPKHRKRHKKETSDSESDSESEPERSQKKKVKKHAAEAEEISISSYLEPGSAAKSPRSPDVIAKYLPEYSGADEANPPPLSAVSRHFIGFWNNCSIQSEKDAVVARQIATGLLEGAVRHQEENNQHSASIRTKTVLTSLKNINTW